MKAITRRKYGPPSVLSIQEIEKPKIKKNEILVRVYSSTVNRTDCGTLWGKPLLIRAFVGLLKPKSLVPGTDFAGKVEAIGKDVKDFAVGDRVWGFNDQGLASHAEFMAIKENQALAVIPEHFSYDQAAASAEGAHYAYNMINKVKLVENNKVLIYGATGAIGSAAVQLCKHFGMYVTAVGNTKNIDLVRSLGPDKVYDYQTEDFTQDDEKYDFVFDAVGKSSFGACKPLMKDKAVYISSELGPGNENLYLPLLTKIKGGKRVIFPIPSNCRRTILFMNKLIENNEFQAIIDRNYKVEEIVDAYEYVVSGQKTGNVLINFPE